ncbi:hypothetical protein BKA67DRAFT_693424 [Truncatella angustata]|uniref:Uncharacterized protein n=1 Tax=Truncatella angustata TaxID=152316 RepID=A0A9P8UHJ8_9PEZI|nr:uncharacterized protein BKA67DRAFT_693424 [Truncatella angustata]KAH6652250.1 hypothetical protein BKA67DRAFT_693424 [Truncatella angustata]
MPIASGESEIVQWTIRALLKFYEPVVLLKALNIAARETAISATANELSNTRDPVELYRAFVYKLAHVCDNVIGGATITAFMILRSDSGGVQYYFASNQRSQEQLNVTQEYVTKLLRRVKDFSSRSSDSNLVHDEVLQLVLLFNQQRLSVYLKRLKFHARECLANPSALDTNDKAVVTSSIIGFLKSSRLETPLPTVGLEFVDRCEELLKQVSMLSKSPAGALIQAQARQGRMPGYRSQACWSEFQHTLSRILAYPESVKFLRKAQKTWPILFDNYEITPIPSSKPIPRPSREKSQTASAIVGRMTREQKKINIFREYVGTLQNFDLDARIQQEWRKESFRPIVHAEIVLLDWLERNGSVTTQRFFNNWKYIGGSKPTCKLCHYYFESHGSKIEHRPSHGNLYISWRFPDVFIVQGEEAKKARQTMMDRVLAKIRVDAFELVEQKVPPSYKDHDSNTFSAMVTLQDRLTIEERSTDGMDIVTCLMEKATL